MHPHYSLKPAATVPRLRDASVSEWKSCVIDDVSHRPGPVCLSPASRAHKLSILDRSWGCARKASLHPRLNSPARFAGSQTSFGIDYGVALRASLHPRAPTARHMIARGKRRRSAAPGLSPPNVRHALKFSLRRSSSVADRYDVEVRKILSPYSPATELVRKRETTDLMPGGGDDCRFQSSDRRFSGQRRSVF